MAGIPAGTDAGSVSGEAGYYERHRPEQTLLYQIIEQHYPDFSARPSRAGNYRDTCSASSRPTSNADASSMVFCGFGARAVMPSTSWRSVANGAVFAPVAAPGAWLRVRRCWWMRSFPNSLCANGF